MASHYCQRSIPYAQDDKREKTHCHSEACRLRSMPCARICFDFGQGLIDVLNLICSTLLFRRQQATALRCERYPICRGDSRIARKSITHFCVYGITPWCEWNRSWNVWNHSRNVWHHTLVCYGQAPTLKKTSPCVYYFNLIGKKLHPVCIIGGFIWKKKMFLM